MKSNAIRVMVIFSVFFLFYAACGSNQDEAIKEAKDARQKAETELQNVKEQRAQAEEIIQNKLNTGARLDSRFEGYATSDNDTGSMSESETEEGTLKGVVAVWGSKPGTVGSSEGMTVTLSGEYDSYYGTVDSDNRYSITAPPGEYTLTINEPGYKYFEKKVTVVSGGERLVPPIGLQNN
ncbi:hypothetical protein ACFL6W_01120 [Thermodesulfobacteriota bacterium]